MRYTIPAAIRTDKKDAVRLCPIYIYLYNGKKRIARIALVSKVHKDGFDRKKRRIKNSVPNSALLNRTIARKIHELEETIFTGSLMGRADLKAIFKIL